MRRPKSNLRVDLTFLVLVVLCVLGPLASFQLWGQERLPSDLADDSGKPTLMTPEELQFVFSGRTEKSPFPEISEERASRAASMASFMINTKRRRVAEGTLHEGACITSSGIYHKPLFLLADDEHQISFEELLRRAEIVVVAEVVLTQTGLVGDRPGTLIHLKLLRSLKKHADLAADEWYYRHENYEFHINGEYLCRKISGLYQEQAGDVVLLTARSTHFPRLIHPYAIFKIEGGVVRPEHYEFLLPVQSVSMSDVEEILN